jgi:hypothetical protein|eukprot:COSAG06_NODE_1001_length_11135_cov_3.577111_6_plen_137_part_00
MPGEADDADFSASWLKDKLHPITGEPLRIQRLELPPGSMAIVLHHSPHAVEPRPPGSGTRHCTLFSFRAPDPGGQLPVTTNADLQPWELERDAAMGNIFGIPPGQSGANCSPRPALFLSFPDGKKDDYPRHARGQS